MTDEQIKTLILMLWEREKATTEECDKLLGAGLMLSDTEPLNMIFSTAADTICQILSCYGLEEDEPFDKLLEAQRADDVNVILRIIEVEE